MTRSQTERTTQTAAGPSGAPRWMAAAGWLSLILMLALGSTGVVVEPAAPADPPVARAVR